MPEPECLLREGTGKRMVPGSQRLGCLVYKRLEDLRVEKSPTEVDPVAASASLDGNPVRGESPAEPGHVGLQAVGCGSRRIIPPDLIEQAPDGHDLVPAEKQGCEHSPLLWSAELDRAFADRGFQRAENAKPEGF